MGGSEVVLPELGVFVAMLLDIALLSLLSLSSPGEGGPACVVNEENAPGQGRENLQSLNRMPLEQEDFGKDRSGDRQNYEEEKSLHGQSMEFGGGGIKTGERQQGDQGRF